MNLNLEWLKKHKVAAGAAILIGVLVLFVLLRKSGSSSSGSDLSSLAANQQQGQLQLAELNAQESAQQNQLGAQVSLSEYQTEAQQQAQQDQLAASLAGTIVPQQIESSLYSEELAGEESQQTALLPLEQQALKISTTGNNSQLGLAELAALLGEGGQVSNKFGSSTVLPSSGFTLTNPFASGSPLMTGLFG